MSLVHKAMAWLLLAAVSSFAAGQTYAPAEAMQKAPSGCHERGQKTPAPGPDAYQCCATGHHTAVLQRSLLLGTLAVALVGKAGRLTPRNAAPGSLPQPFSADSPPTVTILRI